MSVTYEVIVASILESDDRFLCIEENLGGQLMLNQPAGRLQVGESPAHGAARETIEQAGYSILPTHVVGIYEYFDTTTSTIFLRIAYAGALFAPDGMNSRGRDPDISAVRWLTYDELERNRDRHRSPYVLRCIDDFRAGKSYPLDLISHFPAFPVA